MDTACDALIIGNTIPPNERFIPITRMNHQLDRATLNRPKPTDKKLLVGDMRWVSHARQHGAARKPEASGPAGGPPTEN